MHTGAVADSETTRAASAWFVLGAVALTAVLGALTALFAGGARAQVSSTELRGVVVAIGEAPPGLAAEGKVCRNPRRPPRLAWPPPQA